MLGERTESRNRQKEQGTNDQNGATETAGKVACGCFPPAFELVIS
jgi:hypothetical protein